MCINIIVLNNRLKRKSRFIVKKLFLTQKLYIRSMVEKKRAASIYLHYCVILVPKGHYDASNTYI